MRFSCIDLMAKITGKRQGQLTGQTTLIEKGYYTTIDGVTSYTRTRLADALISTITELGGFSRYTIYPIPKQYEFLPYDIKVGVGSTVYSILSELMNIISTWEMFFDLDGIFVVRPIPSGENAIVYNLDEAQYISDELAFDFQNVKNQVVVYGRINTLNYFTENTESSISVSASNNATITNVNVSKVLFENFFVDSGTYSFIFNGENWLYNSEVIELSEYGITFEGEPQEEDGIIIVYEQANLTNVEYIDNGTLILRYSSINTDSVAISATTFGFKSLSTTNSFPITNIQIYSGENLLATSSLVKFENSNNSFGNTFDTTQIEINTFEPDEIYFIRVYNASVVKNGNDIEGIDFSKDIIFEFVGKQSVSYCLVNDNIQSPFYINKNLIEPNYYAGLAQYDSLNMTNNYVLKLNNTELLSSLPEGSIITFMANKTSVQNQKIDVYNKDGSKILGDIPIVKNEWNAHVIEPIRDPIDAGKLYNDYTIWMVQYEKTDDIGQLVLLGRNPNSITKICSGGEYDNIYSDQLAYERCLYELFMTSNMNDSITLGVVPNYLLDVNCKIAYRPNSALPQSVKVSIDKEETQHFIIKQISYPLGIGSTPQSISAIRIYDSGNLVGVGF